MTNRASCHHLYRRRTACHREPIPWVSRCASTAILGDPNLYAFNLRRPLMQDSGARTGPGIGFAPEPGVLPAKLGRYAAVATLLLKRRPDLITPDADTGGANAAAESAEAERLTKDLEQLGPTFIKLGQVLSTRADLLPPSYLEALSRLQDDVDPVPLAEIQQTIEDDLNVRMSKAFLTFDAEPLASASLGQVHRATLRDGRPVAVKVQRPGILDQVLADLTVLDEIAAFVDHHTKVGKRYEFAPMMQEFRKALMEEL